jgi:hypothetical protein
LCDISIDLRVYAASVRTLHACVSL